MIKFLQDLFSRSDLLDTTNRKDYLATQNSDIGLQCEKKVVKSNVPNSQSELEILVKELGELHKGEVIEISLSRLLELLPRNRHKADAYKSVRTALMKQYGVTLLITSSKSNRL